MSQDIANQKNPILIMTACASQDEAIKIAKALVQDKLVACAQIHGDMTSIYEWDQKMEAAKEAPLHLKTINGLWQEVEQVIKSLHSYEVPEIIAIPIVDISPQYLKWLIDSVKT